MKMNNMQRAIAPSPQARDRLPELSSNTDLIGSTSFKRSGKDQPCPICGRTKDGDCGWNDEVVYCHTHVNQDICIPGYVYRGCNDIWSLYFPTSAQSQKAVRAKAEKEFLYFDREGQPLVKVTRIDDGAGKKKIFQSRWNGQQWVKGLTPDIKQKIRLYRISDPINREAIAQQQPLLIVEGEGKVDLLLSLGIAATSAIGGAGKWKGYGYPNYLEDLEGAKVILCPDQDKPGLEHCLEIEQDFSEAQWLYAFPGSLRWRQLPDKGGLDIADWVSDHQLTAEQILAAIEPKRNLAAATQIASQPLEPEKKTIAQLLLDIAQEASYFHTPDQKVYADIQANGVRETYPVRNKAFKQWLYYELFKRQEKTVGSETLSQVLSVVEAKAKFEGEEQETYLRIAEYKGKVYLDLGTEDWNAVEIGSDGWQVVSDYPVRFRRPNTLLPLPIPEVGGSLIELKHLLNFDEDAWVLVIYWLLFSLYPKHPHPVLILHGEQGTGKSHTAKVLRTLIDPGKAPLIPNVADLRNLAIAAENRWVLAYDNLSGLSAEQSDALCRISTGGGFSTRTLYENEEETVFEFIRPQILTGIDSLATRGDLLERALLVQLPTIPEERRTTEAQLEATLTRLQPRILGALLTALSKTLKTFPTTHPDRLPRMADFARFAIAAETALDLPPGQFLEVYTNNRQEAHETALEASPVAVAIQHLMSFRCQWQGTPSELLAALEKIVDEKTIKSKAWAGNSRSLGKALNRLAPDLRGIGIGITCSRKNSSRLIHIGWLERRADSTSLTSPTSHFRQEAGLRSDISTVANVTSEQVNVTRDNKEDQDRHMSPNANQNVTRKSVMQQQFQRIGDNSDVCDNKILSLSNWVGKTVKKREKQGWRGTVQSVSDDMATVLWVSDRFPEKVSLAELEVIETA